MVLLFGLRIFPTPILRATAAWKEGFVLALAGAVAVRALLGRGNRTVVVATDVAVASLLALVLVYLIGQNVILNDNIPRAAALWGARDVGLYLLLYYVGRATPEIASDERTLQRLYQVALVTSILGVIEVTLISPAGLAALGVASYFQDFLGTGAFTSPEIYGLASSTFTRIAGVEVRRAGSVYLSGQGFALPFLILMPAATMWVVTRRPRASLPTIAGYAVIWTGLLLTITRITILACVLQMVAITLMLRRPVWTAAAVGGALIAFVAGLFIVPSMATFVWDTLTWQTGSSVSHLRDWASGIRALEQAPWGAGLGTTDAAAVRGGLEPLTADNMYLKYAVEMGPWGLAAFLATMGGIMLSAARVWLRGRSDPQRAVGMVVILTAAGVLFNGLTSMVFNALVLSYLFFWLAGTVTTVALELSAHPVPDPRSAQRVTA